MVSPTLETLRGLTLGKLPFDEAERVCSWIDENPSAASTIDELDARDPFIELLAGVSVTPIPPDPAVERIVRRLAECPQFSTGEWENLPGLDESSDPESSVPLPAPFGKYRVIKELGHGGMGVVYKAIDDALGGREVAIKVLNKRFAADPTGLQRFIREARAAARIDSDHAVKIYHVIEEGESPYIVMEYVQGPTLQEWFSSRTDPFSAEEVIWVARDLLTGLAAAHEKGLIHRDIKPANAIIDTRKDPKRIKILDFGLMRSADAADGVTVEGCGIWTPAYVSPEQVNGAAPDPCSDVFSVGLVLYRMVTGRSPYHSGMPVTTENGKTVDPPPLTAGLPPELCGFIARLMAPNPGERPADAGAALALLERVRLDPRRGTKVAACIAAVVAAMFAVIIVIFREKDKVVVVDTETGKTITISIGKVDGKAIPLPEIKKVEPPWPIGRRVKVQPDLAPVHESDKPDLDSSYLATAGDTGTVLKTSQNGNRLLIKWDVPREDGWVFDGNLDIEK